jgi:hypothetical protein
MSRSASYRIPIIPVAVSLLTAGCPIAPAPLDTVDVVLPGGVTQPVDAGTGPELLAGGAWAGFRKHDGNERSDLVADPAPGPDGSLLNGGLLARPPADTQAFILDLAADGRATRLRENAYFIPELYTSTSAIDGTFLSTTLPEMTYSLQSFGVSVDDAMGIAIVSDVRYLGMPVGMATIYAWGSGDTDRIDGQFGYLLDFSNGLGGLLFESGGDQYPFYLLRQD